MPEIKIKIDDLAVQGALQKLSRQMIDLSPIMKIIGERVLLQTENRFRSEGPAPDGTSWAPLSPRTLKRKKGTKILTESAQLRGSMRYQLLGSNAVAIGTNKIYAAIHQLGGDINVTNRSVQIRHRTDAKGNLLRTDLFNGKGLIFAKNSHKRVMVRWAEVAAHKFHIPARPYLGLSRENSAEIVEIINQYIRQR